MKNVKFDMKDDILLAELFGEIDHHSAASLRIEIDAALRAFRTRHLVLDYSKVEFMDSSGIGLAMGRYRYTCDRGGMMVIVPGNETISRLLSLSGIFGTIPRSKNIRLAVSYIEEEKRRLV